MENTPSKFASWSLFASSVLMAAAIIAGAIINRPQNTPLAKPLQVTNAPPGMVLVSEVEFNSISAAANAYSSGEQTDVERAFIRLAWTSGNIGRSWSATTNLIASIRAVAPADSTPKH